MVDYQPGDQRHPGGMRPLGIDDIPGFYGLEAGLTKNA